MVCFNDFSSDCQFPRGWLLPIMKESIKETELQYFIDEFLPVAAHLKQRGMFYIILGSAKYTKYKIFIVSFIYSFIIIY